MNICIFQTLGEYTFGYNEDHTSGGSFRRETSDRLGNKVGSYGLRVGDGRVRIVNYVADHNGFRADVISNEPGIESQDANQFSKITKSNNIYSILVPGFKYSSIAPYVTFHSNQQASNPYDGLIDEAHQYEAENGNFEGEDVRNVYVGEDGREENPANVYSNENDSYGQMYAEEDPSSMYVNQGQVLDDSFLSGEYSHDSETVLQNQTANTENTSRAYEGESSDLSSTTDSSNLKDEPLGSLQMNRDNRYYSERASEDLYPFQSNVVLSKSKEHGVASPDDKNATLDESDSSENNVTTTVNSTTVIA